jgi:hypothetical protein
LTNDLLPHVGDLLYMHPRSGLNTGLQRGFSSQGTSTAQIRRWCRHRRLCNPDNDEQKSNDLVVENLLPTEGETNQSVGDLTSY